MTEKPLETNKNTVPLDAEHLCNLCQRRTGDAWPHTGGELVVRLHGCADEHAPIPDLNRLLMTRCSEFVCLHAANPWATSGCEQVPCVCLRRAAA